MIEIVSLIIVLSNLLLIAAKCSPSIINEMRDSRAALGETGKFKVQFAGNPKPGIVKDIFLSHNHELSTFLPFCGLRIPS